MNKLILLTVVTLLLCTTQVFAAMIEPARLRYVEGSPLFRTPESDSWTTASVNTPLDEGDALRLPAGTRIELELNDGTLIRLNSGSELNILANDEDFFHVNLAKGALYLKRPKRAAGAVLQIDADDTTVLPDPGTRLRLDMYSNGQEDVSIFRGAAYVEGSGGRTRVRAGEHMAFEERHTDLLPFNSPDNWEKWNRKQDLFEAGTVTTESPLPEELQIYSTELNANGRWVNSAEYGMVWLPTAIPSDDWSPYSYGRWSWRGGDYVWIGAESWGWAPYHYGRWTIVGSYGWCWIPPARGDVYWAPAYVGWYNSGVSVAWTPLAPGEIFYGYGFYGRHSVNIATTNINVTTVNYRNRDYRGGLLAQPRHEFAGVAPVKPRHAAVRPETVNLTPGRPLIRNMPDVRKGRNGEAARQEQPRERHDSRELRDRFPRVFTTAPERGGQQPARPAAVTAPQTAPGRTVAPVQTRVEPQQPAMPRVGQRLNPPLTGTRQAPSQTAPGRSGENAGRRDNKDRKIWRVRTPEAPKEREHR